MIFKLPDPEPVMDKGEATVAKENRFFRDRLLRSHDFTIHSRKKDRSPLWVRKGQVFSESEALAIVHAEIKAVER